MHFNLTTATEQDQARARDAALGTENGPCCRPEEGLDPCVSCLVPDLFPDEPCFIPSPEDELARLEFVRDYDARIVADRIAEDEAYAAICREESNARLAAAVFAAVRDAGSFQSLLADLANAMTDHAAADVRWVGRKIGELHDAAIGLEAEGGEQFDDRADAMADSRL